jgi:hypothetical protein
VSGAKIKPCNKPNGDRPHTNEVADLRSQAMLPARGPHSPDCWHTNSKGAPVKPALHAPKQLRPRKVVSPRQRAVALGCSPFAVVSVRPQSRPVRVGQMAEERVRDCARRRSFDWR